MKKINNYSVQYKIIQSHKNNPNPRSFANKNPEGASHKKILSKERQVFINNIAASGFKQFNL